MAHVGVAWGHVRLCRGYTGVISRIYRDNGKERGKYHSICSAWCHGP